MIKTKNNKLILTSLIFIIYIGVPLLILFDVINYESKFIFLTIGTLLVYFVLKLIGISNKEMGLTLNDTKKAIVNILPFTILLFVLAVAIYLTGYAKRFEPTETISFYAFYIFLLSPLQEFLYRGALLAILDELKLNSLLICLVSSILYSFVHVIYKDIFTLILTFLIGIIWFEYYRKSKNLIGVSISHSVLGVLTIFLGIID